MFIYVRPKGYEGKELVTLGTFASLLEIVKQYKGIDVKIVAGVGEKLSPAAYRQMERVLQQNSGRDVNAFIKPVVWRFPFLEDEQNLWSEEVHNEGYSRNQGTSR